MIEPFKADMHAAFARGASDDELIDIVCRSRDAGLPQKAAYEALEALRAPIRELLGEAGEDRVLELMDLGAGWCSPGKQLWKDELKT